MYQRLALMAYIEAQRTHFDKKVSKEMRPRPISNRRDIVLWTTLWFVGSPPESQAQVIILFLTQEVLTLRRQLRWMDF